MWLITEFGFFSVVQKPGDVAAKTLTLRARVRADLEALQARYLPALGEIVSDEGTDYQFRATASREAVGVALLHAALDIAYANFKATVEEKQGPERAHVYHDVWAALNNLAGLPLPSPHFADPAQRTPIRQKTAYGGVLFDQNGQVLLREPKNHFDGTVWTFPKGKPASADSCAEDVALREVREETGYRAEILARIPGSWSGSTSSNEYFLMRPVGEPRPFDRETESIRWVPVNEASTLIEMSTKEVARTRDLKVLNAAVSLHRALVARTGTRTVRLPAPDESVESLWLREALVGNFTALPPQVDPSDSSRFAHLFDWYELAPSLGLGSCAELANQRALEFSQCGEWRGNAAELWACLFFEHRRLRHAGIVLDPEGRLRLDRLWTALRAALVTSGPESPFVFVPAE